MSLLRAIIIFSTFFLVITLSFYLVLFTAKRLGMLKKLSFVRHCFLPTIAYTLLLFATDSIAQPLNRWLLDAMGLLSFAAVISLILLLLSFLLKIVGYANVLNNKLTHLLFICGCLGLTAFAKYQFNQPLHLVELTFESDKIERHHRFIHISDIQYGTISKQRMQNIIQQVYQLQPEFIVFTGDLVDSSTYTTEDFKILTQSPVPIFFERGNHEFYHDPIRLLTDLKTIAPITLLDNKQAILNNIQIVGVDYSKKKGHLQHQLQQMPLDENKFSILLHHEPIHIEAGTKHGFDLMLYGHTHGGQIWPWTQLIDLLYEYGDGYFKVGKTHIYTSDGVALWGPRMRLGSQNEIVIINLIPVRQAYDN